MDFIEIFFEENRIQYPHLTLLYIFIWTVNFFVKLPYCAACTVDFFLTS